MSTSSPFRPGFVLTATCLAFVVVLIDVSVVNVALNTLSAVFRADVTGLQWVINAYALVFASTLLMAGTMGDRFGAKPVLITGYMIFTLASLGCGFAQSIHALIAWRLVQGIGASLLVPNSLSVLRQAFADPATRSRAIGWWGAGGGIALAAGPVIGGLLVDSLGWRSIFLVNLPIGIIGMAITARHAPATVAQPGRKLDLAGQAACVSMLATLTFALTEASGLGWQSPLIWIAFALCIASGALFIRLQARNPEGMLPLALIGDSTVRSTAIIGVIVNLVFYGIVFTFSLLFQSIWHLSPERTGLAFLPMMAILMLMNIAAGRLIDRMGARALTTIALLISAAGYLSMLPALGRDAYWLLVAPMLFAGGGIALAIPTITNAMLAAVNSSRSGIASGLLNAARQIGGVMGVALFGFLVRHPDPTRFIRGVQDAIFASVVLLLIGAAVAHRNLSPREDRSSKNSSFPETRLLDQD